MKQKQHVRTRKNKKPERNLQIVLSKYISLQYPNVIFCCDMQGMRLPLGLAIVASRTRSISGYPDMFIACPKFIGGKHYSGMYLELKVTTPFKADGSLKKDKHLEQQQKTLQHLESIGYYAKFGVGIDDCIRQVDWYMTSNGNPKTLKEEIEKVKDTIRKINTGDIPFYHNPLDKTGANSNILNIRILIKYLYEQTWLS